jgi:hypothetical protein
MRLSKYWSYEKCKEEALKYTTRNDFSNSIGGAYSSALKHGWIDEICSHMKRKKRN